MKLITAFVICISLGFISLSCYADDASHWSAGIGSNYGGIGVKYSQEINSRFDLYANLGASTLFGIYAYKKGVAASLGAEFTFAENQHHSLHTALAIMDGPDYSSDYSEITDKNRLSGYLFGYTYYFSGMHSTGQALGVSTIILTGDDEILTSLSISWGYRF
jgi:hypothetical protein